MKIPSTRQDDDMFATVYDVAFITPMIYAAHAFVHRAV